MLQGLDSKVVSLEFALKNIELLQNLKSLLLRGEQIGGKFPTVKEESERVWGEIMKSVDLNRRDFRDELLSEKLELIETNPRRKSASRGKKTPSILKQRPASKQKSQLRAPILAHSESSNLLKSLSNLDRSFTSDDGEEESESSLVQVNFEESPDSK